MADAVEIPGSLRRVRLWSLAAASATIGIYARNDTIGQFARQRSFVVSLAIGLNEFSADDGDFDALPVSAGEFAAISVSGGVMAYSSSAADGAGWYTASAVDPATFTDAAVATNLRLEIGFDIVSRPVPITSKVPLGDGWNHVIADGQSNGVGATNGVVINTTPSDYHLTFDSGVKAAPVLTDGNNPATGTQALVEDTISPITGLSGSIYGDVGLWQFAAEFSRKRALAGVVPTLFCSSAAYSGAAAFKLAAGSPWWQVMIYHVRKAKEYADAAGVPYRVTAITFDHGESDQQTGTIAKADYRRLIENRIDCLWHDVAEITGQKDRPQWLFTTSPYHITTSDATTEAINDLCRDRADCHLVTGGYRFEHRTDQLHLTATGQCVKRAMQARVLSRLVDGQPAPVIRWLGASGGGTSVVVRASSPAPLALNTTIVASVTASGFAVSDADGAKTVSGVALGASVWSDLYGAYLTDITLTINTSLGAAPIVRYAKTAIGASPVIASGAAGNVFDTTDDPVTVGGSPQSMANAAPPVTLKIHVPE